MTDPLPPEALQIAAAVGLFTVVVLLLVGLVLAARSLLEPKGDVALWVNRRELPRARRGLRLLEALADRGVAVPAGCGGKGTCGLCAVTVVAGGGAVLPVERGRLGRADLAGGRRLACQVTLVDDLRVELPEEWLGVRQLACTVRSNLNVATFMKEVVLDLPAGEALEFRAGDFVEVLCPPFHARFRDFDVAPRFREDWDRLDLWRHEARSAHPLKRAYSLANHPGEKGIALLVVRIATPPPGSPPDIPPGKGSSYLFSLRPGDLVTISGPYGTFHVADTQREMILVGGGAGMAPMRSMVLDQLLGARTGRRIGFWYGARSLRELFYRELFDRLAAEHRNFDWHVVLSEPLPGDEWDGLTGFVHLALEKEYLRNHPQPEECEYYLCGPPLMVAGTLRMLDALGVPPEHVFFDDFGGN